MKSPSSLAARRGVSGREWRYKRLYDERSRDREYGRRIRMPRPLAAKERPIPKTNEDVHWMEDDGHGALSQLRVILVGTQSPGNIGAVCRAASNFECRDVWLVNPDCDYHADEARYMATNPTAKTILEEVSVSRTLREALGECHMAIGFTRRHGRDRIVDMPFSSLKYPPRSVVTGLVFGRENDGLTNEELDYCTHRCTIPSSKWDGSLNLSHAVSLTLSSYYEKYLRRKAKGTEPVPNRNLEYNERTAPLADVSYAVSRWKHVLRNANVAASLVAKPEVETPAKFLQFMRNILYRGRPTTREVKALHGFLSLVEGNSHSVGNLVCHLEARESDQDEEDEDYDTFLEKAMADEAGTKKFIESQDYFEYEESEEEQEG